MAKPSLSAVVLERVRGSRTGPASWFEKLPTDVQAELVAVREQFRAGTVKATKNSLGRVIHDTLIERGLPCCKPQQVVKWLDAR